MVNQQHALSAILAITFSAVAVSAGAQKTLTTADWAGIVNFEAGEIVEVSGDIIVPSCSPGLPYMSYYNYTTDGWVGLNGWVLPPSPKTSPLPGLLQTGVICNSGTEYHRSNYSYTHLPASYQLFTEYYPSPPIVFNTSDVVAGDIVHARVNKINYTSGETYLRNLRTGTEWKWTYTNESAAPLPSKNTNAEWITETETFIVQGLNLAEGTFTANFTQWGFENAKYKLADGTVRLAGPADPINCILNGTEIAKGEWRAPGSLVVVNTTPDNFTLQTV